MAEEVIYDQVESGGDPDPLGLRKKLAQTKQGNDPLGLRVKLGASAPPSQPAFQISLSNPTFKSAPAQTGPRTFTDTKPTDELASVKLEGKAQKALQNIQSELMGNHDVKVGMIKQRRFEEAAQKNELSKSDMPKTQAQIDVERIIPQQTKPQDLPVTMEDIDKENEALLKDRGKAVRLMEELIKTQPWKAKKIQKDIYTLDAYNSLANTPDVANERASKIEANAKLLEKGSLIYEPRSQQLIKPLGTIGAIIHGTMNKFKADEEYKFLKETTNDSAVIKELEDERNNPDPDRPLEVPKGRVSEIFGILSEMPLSPMAAGVIGSLASPAAGVGAATAVGAYENRKIQYRNVFKQIYNELRDKDVTPYEALQEARKKAEFAQEIGTIVGGAQGLVGQSIANTPLKTVPLNPSYIKSVGNLLKQNRSELGQMFSDGAAQGILGVAQEISNNMGARSLGINRDITAGAMESFVMNMGMAVGIGAALKAGRGLTKIDYKNILHGVSKFPEEAITSNLQEKVQSGEITQKAADETLQRINDYKALDSQIPKNITEDARFKIQDKITKRAELENQLEGIDKAYHPAIKEKIKAIDEEIITLSKETEKPIKTESGLSKSQEKEATELAEEWLHEGIVPDTYEAMIKQDPIGFWKMIAQQAQNRDENWRPLGEQINEQAIRDQFGDTVVDYAKELFPVADRGEKGVLQKFIEEEYKGDDSEVINASEDSLKSLFKQIADMAHDPEMARHITYNEKIINKAKELYPKEQASESKVSIIQPGEIKHPETITIKPKENAQTIRSDEGQIRESGIEPQRSPEQSGGDIQFNEEQKPITPETEQQTGGGNPKEEGSGSGQEGVSEPEMVGITHAQMDKVSRELGLPEYSKDPESFASWTKEAKDRLAKDPNAINNLINKLRRGEDPDPVETQMMKMHFAALKGKYDVNPTPELRAEIARTKDLYNISGRSEGKKLAARKGLMPVDENSLFDFHQRDVEFNRGAPLTEAQTAQSTKEFNEIKAAKDALDEKVMKLEAENAKLKAEKELKKIAGETKKSEKKDYKSERDQILKDIADKWKKSSKENLGASFVPYAKELAAIAPDVIKLVKNVVSEGIEKLPDVIKAVHKQVKNILPEITEKDVHDIIAGEYNKKKEPRNEIAEKLYNLRLQAKLVNKLEALEAGIQPKNEKQRIKRNQEIEDLRKKIKELQGDTRTNAEKLAALKARYKSDIEKLQQKLDKGDYAPDEKPEPIVLDKEGKELRDKYLELKEEREIRLLKQEYENRSALEKGVGVISKAVKTGRTLQSSFDVSYPFRQTITGVSRQLFSMPFTKKNGKWSFDGFRNQKQLLDQFGKMYRSFASEKSFRSIMDDIHQDPRYEMAQEAGLSFADPLSNLDRAKEEMFQKSYAEDIPVAKIGVKASHRAATTIANKMKWDIFTELTDRFADQGKTFENSKELYEATAKYANQLIGRGILGEKLEMAAPVIAHFVYSLRLYASRLQLLTYLVNPNFYRKVPAEIRIEYLKDMTKFLALGGTIMGLASAAGLSVGLNPNDADFGSISVGDTKYDIWGGFKQYAVLMSRILSGHANSKQDLRPLFSDEPFDRNQKTRGDVLLRFLRTKASPELGAIINITTGKGFDNKPVTLKSAAADYFIPLIYKDVRDVYKDGGVAQSLLTFLLAAHGVGVQTYTNDNNKSNSGTPSRRVSKSRVSKTKK